MKENGQKVKGMAMENKLGKMEVSMKVNGNMIKVQVRVN